MRIKRGGRQGRRRGREDNTASSDIAFLLIIYFIVIAGFNINEGLLLSLPAKDSLLTLPRDTILRYELDGAGGILSGGARIGIAEAELAMREGLSANPNLAILLTVAPGAPWQSVVSFVELARKLDAESFSFRMAE
jgi:biopolymer transport protein ExbD